MIANTNDGSSDAPRLRCDLNLGTLNELPDFATAPRGTDEAIYRAIKAAGYEGIQGGDPKLCAALSLGYTTGGRVNEPADAENIARTAVDEGAAVATLHVGWGIEDDDEVDALVDAVLNASAKHNMPLYIETHRATITQDIWRSVKLVERFPDVRFNGDFSHWYTGLEMPYGGVERKLDFAQPVFDRVRFMHGRIGNSGCMQVDIGDGTADFVSHFREMWTRSMACFLQTAGPGDYLVFAPELLQPSINYARAFVGPDGKLTEECDRWQQALDYCKIAKECFAAAQSRVGG